VLYRKHSGGKDYVVADAGMTELLRPSHYGAFHRIQASRSAATSRGGRRWPGVRERRFSALERRSKTIVPGDLLIVYDAGAYGYAMASNYNSRLRPAEVLVDGDRFAVMHARERMMTSLDWKPMDAALEEPDARWADRRHHDRFRRSPSSFADAGGGSRMVLHAGTTCAPFSLKPFEEAHVSLAGVFGATTAIRRACDARQAAFGTELFESPHSFELERPANPSRSMISATCNSAR
jgi:hypothetical protein